MTYRHSNWGQRLLRAAITAATTLVLLVGTMNTPVALAQTQRTLGVVELKLPGSASQNLYDQSYALVIGASNYRNGWPRLPGVVDDVKAVAAVLVKQGFSVSQVSDPSRDQLDAALRNFVAQHGQSPGNRLLIYFAGHGHTLTTAAGGRLGYIVPVDAPRPDLDLGGFKRSAYSMDSIEGLAKQMDSRHALFLFDSCFSGTIFRTRAGVPDSISEKTSRPVRQFITSGDENQTVPDQSIFRRQLVAALGEGEADLNHDGYITGSELGMFLEDKVTDYSRRTQTPRWGRIRDPDLDKGDFVFVTPMQVASIKPEPVGPSVVEMEQQAWSAAQRVNSLAGYNTYLAEYPRGSYASAARVALAGLEPPPRQPDPVTASQSPTPPHRPVELVASFFAGQTIKDCDVCPEMVVISAGSFKMGSNESNSEQPVHNVTIKSFAMGKYEVTQGQWKAVMGSNPSRFKECGDTCPVERVSWDDSQLYIQKLNALSGQLYRLPSEAEWEYSCRAGGSQPYCGSDDLKAVGWYDTGADSVSTHSVGGKQANAWGLYDMSGNVGEWTQDCANSNYSGAPSDGSAWTTGNCRQRDLRGGSWGSSSTNARAALRSGGVTTYRDFNVGFRLARKLP